MSFVEYPHYASVPGWQMQSVVLAENTGVFAVDEIDALEARREDYLDRSFRSMTPAS